MADNDERLLSAIDMAEADAYGSDSDSMLSADRARAIELYAGTNIDPVPAGRTDVVDRSVFETIQWIMPSLCRIFAGGDDVVEFQPIGPEDEAAAKQESEYLNFLITQRNRWFEICHEWFTDALLTKNAYCWAYLDTKVNVEKERYENQTMEGVTMLSQQDGVEIIGAQQKVDDKTGQPLIDVEIKRTREKPMLALKVLPPERCKVSESTPSFSLRDCDYFEYWDNTSISDLRREGYDVPDDITDSDNSDTDEDDARDAYDEERANDAIRNDPSLRKVKVRCVWIRYDYDGDGIAEMQYVVVVGKTILYREECSRIPVSSIVPIPMAHRHMGLSIADIVGDIQRIKTAILRQGIDNLYYANNPAVAFDKNKVSLDDLLTSRPGQRIRVDGTPMDSFMPVVTPFVFPQAMEGLEYMDQVRENRTGTNRYFTGVDQNAMNKTATGIQQLSTMAAQRVEQIARIFACGVEELFSVCHELILKSGHTQEVVRLRGGWVQVDPSQWKERSDMKISVGFAAGNKDAMVARLTSIWQLQQASMQMGLPIVKPENMHRTALELVKASDFSQPDGFFTDPKTVQPPPPPQPDITVMAAEQLKSQTTLQKTQMDNQTKLQIEAMQRELEAAKLQMAPQMEREKAQIGLVAKREEMQQAAQLERERMAVGFDMEAHKAALSPETKNMQTTQQGLGELRSLIEQSNEAQTQLIVDAFKQIAQTMGAERELIRDPKTNRISGFKLKQTVN
jgi:hypothetical protein